MNTYSQDTFVGTAGTPLSSHVGQTGATWSDVSNAGGQITLDGNGAIYAAGGTGYIEAVTTCSGSPGPSGATKLIAKGVFKFLSATADAFLATRISGEFAGYVGGYDAGSTTFQILVLPSQAGVSIDIPFPTGESLPVWFEVDTGLQRLYVDFGDEIGPQCILQWNDTTYTGTESGGNLAGFRFGINAAETTGIHIGNWDLVDSVPLNKLVAGVFDPTIRQRPDTPDLTYQSDYTTEFSTIDGSIPEAYTPGIDGISTGILNDQLINYSAIAVANGVFTPKSSNSTNTAQLPIEGIFPSDQWQVSMTVSISGQSWASYGGSTTIDLLHLGDEEFGLILQIAGSKIFCYVTYTPTGYSVSDYIFTTGNGWDAIFAAGTPVTLTLNRTPTGVLAISVNGTPILWENGRWTGCPTPNTTASNIFMSGFVVGGGDPTISFSNVFVTRYARTAGQVFINPGIPTFDINLSADSISTVNQALRGGVSASVLPNQTIMQPLLADALSGGGTIRLGSTMHSCGVAASESSSTPDQSPLNSGYWYDFGPMRREADIAASYGASIRLELGSTPQLLGGGTSPMAFSSTQTADSTAWNPQVPTSNSAMATVAADHTQYLYNYCQEKGYMFDPYVTIWNEPDNGEFWLGTQAQFAPLYNAISIAIHNLNLGIKTGPEIADAVANDVWLTDSTNGLFYYCKAHGGFLDTVFGHFYNATNEWLVALSSILTATATASAMPLPQIGLGEVAWDQTFAYNPGGYWQPYNNYNLNQNAWGAAWIAQNIMECQRLGVVRRNNTFTTWEIGNPIAVVASMGIVEESTATPGVVSFVMQLWKMMLPTVVWQPAVQIEAGVRGIASTDGKGNITLMLSYQKLRRDRNIPLKFNIANLSSSVTELESWIVGWDGSAFRSDPQDGGQAVLEQGVSVPVDSEGNISVTLTPQSVLFLKSVKSSSAGSYQAIKNSIYG